MKPVSTKETNTIFGLDGYEKLPAEMYTENMNGTEMPCVQTVWELDDDEVRILEKTRKIFISTVGERPQPISVSVTSFTGVEE